MLKEGKDGTQRLNGTMRKKMGEWMAGHQEQTVSVWSGEYYHDILWRTTGQLVEEPLLWQSTQER